jgi:hypothetical protein
VGAVGLGVGVVTGIMALDAASTVRSTFPGGTCATPDQVSTANDAKDKAHTMALVSTVGIAVGIIGAGVGTYLLVKTPSQTTVAPSVGQGSAGLVVSGRF